MIQLTITYAESGVYSDKAIRAPNKIRQKNCHRASCVISVDSSNIQVEKKISIIAGAPVRAAARNSTFVITNSAAMMATLRLNQRLKSNNMPAPLKKPKNNEGSLI